VFLSTKVKAGKFTTPASFHLPHLLPLLSQPNSIINYFFLPENTVFVNSYYAILTTFLLIFFLGFSARRRKKFSNLFWFEKPVTFLARLYLGIFEELVSEAQASQTGLVA
jgi:hypothetical protein